MRKSPICNQLEESIYQNRLHLSTCLKTDNVLDFAYLQALGGVLL